MDTTQMSYVSLSVNMRLPPSEYNQVTYTSTTQWVQAICIMNLSWSTCVFIHGDTSQERPFRPLASSSIHIQPRIILDALWWLSLGQPISSYLEIQPRSVLMDHLCLFPCRYSSGASMFLYTHGPPTSSHMEIQPRIIPDALHLFILPTSSSM